MHCVVAPLQRRRGAHTPVLRPSGARCRCSHPATPQPRDAMRSNTPTRQRRLANRGHPEDRRPARTGVVFRLRFTSPLVDYGVSSLVTQIAPRLVCLDAGRRCDRIERCARTRPSRSVPSLPRGPLWRVALYRLVPSAPPSMPRADPLGPRIPCRAAVRRVSAGVEPGGERLGGARGLDPRASGVLPRSRHLTPAAARQLSRAETAP